MPRRPAPPAAPCTHRVPRLRIARCPPPQESISWTCSSTTSSSTCALPSSSCPAHSNGVSRCAERAKHVHEFRPSRARALHVHELCLENDHVAHENDDRAQVSIQQLSKSVLTICESAEGFRGLSWLSSAIGDSNARPVGRSIANGDEIRPAGRAFLRS